MTDSFPVLYILMRNDLESMNPGKAMAQASHASNAFWMHAVQYINGSVKVETEVGEAIADLASAWQQETAQGFGTVLVLEVNETRMRTAATVAESLGFVSGVVHDPTYPLPDGDTCHFIPLDTCAYVFGDKNDPMLEAVVGNFLLHP